MLLIDSILRVLSDGSWYPIKEVQEYSEYSQVKTATIIKFLSRFGFVDLSKNKKQVKLSPPMLKFMTEIEKIEESTHQSFYFRVFTQKF